MYGLCRFSEQTSSNTRHDSTISNHQTSTQKKIKQFIKSFIRDSSSELNLLIKCLIKNDAIVQSRQYNATSTRFGCDRCSAYSNFRVDFVASSCHHSFKIVQGIPKYTCYNSLILRPALNFYCLLFDFNKTLDDKLTDKLRIL